MYKLKLIKGLSYRGGNDGKVKVTKDKPFCVVEDMEEAEALLASGHFQMVELPKVIDLGNGYVKIGDQGLKVTGGNKGISNMIKDELIAFAAENEIDISECKNNDERKKVIIKALEEKVEVEDSNGQPESPPAETKIVDEGKAEEDSSQIPFEEE